jgi:FAD dependent oxidoreductase
MPPDGSQPIWVDDPDAAPTARTRLPVAVIGAGPVGLATAAHLLDRGLEPLVLEAGPQVGANIAQWRHVRLFSPWRFNLDPASVRLLTTAGWQPPDPGELPALAAHIRVRHRVVTVTRQGVDKVRSAGREDAPFAVRVHTPAASGTCRPGRWSTPRGPGGSPTRWAPPASPPSASRRPVRPGGSSPACPTFSAPTVPGSPAGGCWSSGPATRRRRACWPWWSCAA